MSHNPDAYYQRGEVSNSDLTELRNILHPTPTAADTASAFRFGTLVDAIITEPSRVNYYRFTVDGVQYSEDEFRHAMEMHKALRHEARHDGFLAKVLESAATQKVSVNPRQQFEYGEFPFTLPTRCKWDWFFRRFHFGGDLKTTFAETQQQFDEAFDYFDWDRSRSWYMDVERTDRDFIYAISKKNCRIFKKTIIRGDAAYLRGRDKYLELAFQYWCFSL